VAGIGQASTGRQQTFTAGVLMANVGERMASGAAWMVLAKFVERGLGVFSTLLLARLLVPADFGLVAVATAVIAVLELLTGFGFDLALIRDQRATRAHFDTAWTLNVLIGLTIGALMLALAIPAAKFFDDVRLTGIVVVLSAVPVLSGLENIGVVAFRKELDFKREFVFLSAKKVMMILTAVPIAWAVGNYWALVAGMVVGRLAATGLSYWMHPFRPRWALSHVGELLGFSKWMFAVNIVNFVKVRYADFVVGRIAGANALGLYSIGAEIASLPTSDLVGPINRALFPGYSMMGDDVAQMRRAYLSVTAVVALVALPAGAAIAGTASILVPLLLGAKWVGAVPVMKIIGIVGMFTALQANSFSIFLAMGSPRTPALLGGLHALLLILLLPLGVQRLGIEGAAWVTLAATLALLPLHYHLLMRLISCGLREIISVIWRPAGAVAVMFLVFRLTVPPEAPVGFVALALANVTALVAGAISYVGTVGALWLFAGRPDGGERTLITRLGLAVWPRAQAR
jgi:O-antigen/teichoic acid export membrane protein